MIEVVARQCVLVILMFVPVLTIAEPTSSDGAQSVLFKKLIDESGLLYVPPVDFIEIKPKANPVLHYEKALRHRSGELEMRLIIRPLGRISIEYNDPHNASPEPNHLFPLLFESLLSELSRGGGNTHNSVYPQTQAKKLFNAGWASAAVFDVNPGFSETYSQALLIGIHKDGQADAYIVFLYNKPSDAKTLIQAAISTLSFAP